eukprot:5573632-Pyramimonas_sp.AAC.1
MHDYLRTLARPRATPLETASCPSPDRDARSASIFGPLGGTFVQEETGDKYCRLDGRGRKHAHVYTYFYTPI